MKPEAQTNKQIFIRKKMRENNLNQCREITTHKDQCSSGISEAVWYQSNREKA